MPSTWCLCHLPGIYAIYLVSMPSTWCLCHLPGVYAIYLVSMLWEAKDPLEGNGINMLWTQSQDKLSCSDNGISAMGALFRWVPEIAHYTTRQTCLWFHHAHGWNSDLFTCAYHYCVIHMLYKSHGGKPTPASQCHCDKVDTIRQVFRSLMSPTDDSCQLKSISQGVLLAESV